MDIEGLKKLAEAATPGEWRFWRQRREPEDTCTFRNEQNEEVFRAVTKTMTAEDAAFIAAANPQTVLALIRELEEAARLRRELIEAKETISSLEQELDISEVNLGESQHGNQLDKAQLAGVSLELLQTNAKLIQAQRELEEARKDAIEKTRQLTLDYAIAVFEAKGGRMVNTAWVCEKLEELKELPLDHSAIDAAREKQG